MDYIYVGIDRRVTLTVLLGMFAAATSTYADVAKGVDGMVATVHPVASQVAIDTFEKGGNAVDAAVAAAVTLGVVDGHNSGLGGGCFILIRQPDGSITCIDGREMAPKAATRDMFLRDGKADTSLSQNGPLAIGVPGALAAYAVASRELGEVDLADSLRAAAEIADDGFLVDRNYARNLARTKEWIAKFPASKKMLLKPDGQPYLEDERLRLPDLAKTYRAMADEGIDWFYGGPFAKRVGEWMKENSGLLTREDFAAYRAKKRQPVRSTYRGYEVVGMSPPSSGGVHVAQILNIVERFELAPLLKSQDVTQRARGYHLIAESMKLAFADRAHWLGDADFARVPRGLAAQSYADSLSQKIKVDSRMDVPSHGIPDDWKTNVYGKHTTHIATADKEGFWVAITATVNTSFGSKVVVPGTGLVLNNEMDDFSAQPGVPNAFNLIGAEANAVAPGKRPLSSMSPSIVLRDGKPVLTVGAAGGPKIITQVVCAIVNTIDRDLSLGEAIRTQRLHHQWRPDRLLLETGFDGEVVAKLKSLGHDIEFLTSGGITQAIAWENGEFVGVADSRVQSRAIGWTREKVPN